MEDYLKEQHGVIEDIDYLKSEHDIKAHFTEVGDVFFDCGQGYLQEEAEVLVHINGKFYKVSMKAEVYSAKQDKGERLYWVESITSVSYEEIEKPKKLPEKTKYILISVDYDENETTKQEFSSVKELQKGFEGDDEMFGELLNEGFHDWEWGSFHLINLGDYK